MLELVGYKSETIPGFFASRKLLARKTIQGTIN
jgi:hypothetical protein